MGDEDFEEVSENTIRRRAEELEADLAALDRLIDRAGADLAAFDVAVSSFDSDTLDTWLLNAEPEKVVVFQILLDSITKRRLSHMGQSAP